MESLGSSRASRAAVDVFHGHRGGLLDGWGALSSMILLQKRMMRLLLVNTAVDVVVGGVP